MWCDLKIKNRLGGKGGADHIQCRSRHVEESTHAHASDALHWHRTCKILNQYSILLDAKDGFVCNSSMYIHLLHLHLHWH
jgi:hypothetical protein